MYKILHIPTACIVYESNNVFYEERDNLVYLSHATLDTNRREDVDGMFISPISFQSKEFATLYLDAHITYESYQPNSSPMLLYKKDFPGDTAVRKIHNYEFEIIEVDVK